MRLNSIILVTFLSFFYFCKLAFGNYCLWVEGGAAQKDGASRDYYNQAAHLKWKHFQGDWIDAEGLPQGLSPYSQAYIKDTDSIQNVEWDITDLVNQWLQGTVQNNGIFLHVIAGNGDYSFRSRECSEYSNQRPFLNITLDNGEKITVEPEADTYLDKSTYKSIGGKSKTLVVGSGPDGKNILIRFPLNGFSGQTIKSAYLKMTSFAQYGSHILIGAFLCEPGETKSKKDQNGIAKNYMNDKGIKNHKDVILFSDFEKKRALEEWSSADHFVKIVESDVTQSFVPFSGNALSIWLEKGKNLGGGLRFKFMEKMGLEPEKVFFRYYLRLANNWHQTVSGGKLPGFLGTYNRAGWGGRKPNGYDGWSARGLFLPTIQEKSNPLFGMTPIGTYCYYADQPEQYGGEWVWSPGKSGFPVKNRWYCIEQYVQLNSPGIKNGVLKAWVDGYQVFEKKNILFRHTYDLKIEEVVLSLYHGGQPVSPYHQHMYIDNVVIARKYIGPVSLNR